MLFHVITIFPQLVQSYLEYGILSRAVKQGLIQLVIHDLRDHAVNRYGQIDDRIFGSGKGMLYRPEPLWETIEEIKRTLPSRVIYLTPQGKPFDNKKARELSREKSVVLISARYEGIDARVVENLVDDEISIGDYVLTGGELPALVVMDAVTRFIDGSIQTKSAEEESFENGLLEHDHYTRPPEYREKKVPEILRTGNHREIGDFRLFGSLKKTYFNRAELLLDYQPVVDGGKSKDPLKSLKRKNRAMVRFLKDMEKISKEWKYGRRNSKD